MRVDNPNPKSQVLKLRYFGFRGNAQFVYLARPLGPGPRFILSFQGPTARPFVEYVTMRQSRKHTLGIEGLGRKNDRSARRSQTVGPLARKHVGTAISQASSLGVGKPKAVGQKSNASRSDANVGITVDRSRNSLQHVLRLSHEFLRALCSLLPVGCSWHPVSCGWLLISLR